MSFNYQVILKPKDVKFSVKKIPSRFDDGKTLKEVYDGIFSGKISCKDIPPAEVVWDSDRWEWYTLSNRRLWVLQELEKNNILTYTGMSRVELVDNCNEKAQKLYSKIDLYDPPWEIAIRISEDNTNTSVLPTKPVSERLEKTSQSNSFSRMEEDSEEEWVEKPESLNLQFDGLKIDGFSKKKKEHFYRSNQSLTSNTSCSTITRNERIVDNSSGLSGYGYYHTYKKEYLDKIKAGKRAVLEKYRPYNVNQSRRHSRCSSRQKLIGSSLNYSCDSVFSDEPVIETERRHSSSSLGRFRRTRNNSHDIDSNETAVVVYKEPASSSCTKYNNGINLADLYSMWQKRRIEYLRSARLAITSSSISYNYYLCGLCFKKFQTIVDLQQHSEALLHYACITCGKFFSSYASLGQHCQRLGHKKD